MKFKIIRIALVVVILVVCFPPYSFASSEYVLPYPSYLPGNFLYQPRLILSRLSYYIYFGDFGRFDYSLKESDHYLVEAKTLFEYKQYLFATRALDKSDSYFRSIYPNLIYAKKNKKNISEKEEILRRAALKHIEILTDLKSNLPEEFIWTPEKSDPTKINFEELIDASIKTRKSVL